MSQPIRSFTHAQTEVVEKGNMGGTSRYIYLIRAAAVASMPSPGERTNSSSGTFTFVDDTVEVFARLRITKKSGDVRFEKQGETEGSSYVNFMDFSFSGMPDQVLATLAETINEDLIGVAQDKQGDFYIIGSLDDPAEIEQSNGQLGKAGADARNVVCIIRAESHKPPIKLSAAPQFEVTVV